MVTGTRSLALVLFICLYNPWTKHGVEAIILEDRDVTELSSPYPDPYSCHFNPCLNGGTCHYLPGLTRTKRLIPPGFNDFGFCECPPSHFGFYCEHKVPDPCTPNPCQNGGSCSSEGREFNCRCRAQYIGRHCEFLNDPCISNPCQNRGSCSSQGSMFSCRYRFLYTGRNCEILSDICAQKPCQNGGTCYPLGKKMHFCFCKPQFTGSSCEKVNCNARPCRNRGTCLSVERRSFCKCPAGITGNLCEGEIPVITKDPQDSIRMEGDGVTLCCQATGKPTPVYEWFHNGAPQLHQLRNRYLHLSGLSSRDSGSYQCRAKNEFGATVSNEATLTVVPGNRDDSCNATPLTKDVSLPEGCKEDSSGSNSVNVGTCSNEACVKRNQGHAGSCGGHDSTRQCCSPALMYDSRVSCINGIKFNIQKVSKCACADCAVSKIVVRGKVVDPMGNPLWRGEMTVSNDAGSRYYTDRRGNFKILVKSGTKRIVLTVKDKFQGLLEETTKVFELHEGQVFFYTIVLQKKPPVIKFPANKKKSVPLGGSGGKPNFVDLDIPANAFLTAGGRVYTGEITATIGVIDPRSQADMTAAPGDFSAINDNGEEVALGSVGMLRQVFTDSNGNQLSLGKNISVRIDADLLDIPNGVTVYQWYLSKETGRWVKFGVLRPEQGGSSRPKRRERARKFFVSEITPNVPLDNINWDYVTVVSYVRITAPPGTVVSRIGLSDNGLQYTSYRQDTVPASGTLCILSLRDKQAILQAERNGAPLIPRQPTGFPLLVNPEIIDGSSVGNVFKIQSFRFTSTKADDRGPIYHRGEDGRCSQRGANDFAFEFRDTNVKQKFDWKSIRIVNPDDPRLWQVRADEICFVKALVLGKKPDSVIYVRSIGKAPNRSDVEYGYTAEKSATVGGEGVVCLEYRCNEGPKEQYQTHLQFLTLTGSCTIQGLNKVLNGMQNRCTVPPASSSSQEHNFCVPYLVGGDAGLYSGDTGMAKNRCLTGNQHHNAVRSTTTNLNPTVTIRCR